MRAAWNSVTVSWISKTSATEFVRIKHILPGNEDEFVYTELIVIAFLAEDQLFPRS